ncbi:MAG: methionyl-tRNA formyltransferase [Clostridiales Family XIII bacterium]|jgi:methionyl-tRNA formyltransferase|nr:methionyl-tRNA formyltransferase [Clostridiales Family XIII bacterium]
MSERSDSPLRVMYMGTPDFAVPALDALHGSPGVSIVCVVTRPDRPRGRGHKTVSTPVKARAESLGLPVVQPESLDQGGEWGAALDQARPDLIVVCAYGKILPKDSLDFPRLGCVNIHASLLPGYRGSAPVHRAVEAGESESGVTLMYMSEGMDEGDMIASRSMPIAGMNSGEATEALAGLGAGLLLDELPAIAGETARREPQNGDEATYAPPVRREEGHIDFTRTQEAVVRKVLAMTPSPGAYTFLGGDKIKVWEARVSGDAANAPAESGEPRPGRVVCTRGIITVDTGRGGAVEIVRLQSPGGKPMGAADWLRGHSIGADAAFE